MATKKKNTETVQPVVETVKRPKLAVDETGLPIAQPWRAEAKAARAAGR